jgi:hypothetical protein
MAGYVYSASGNERRKFIWLKMGMKTQNLIYTMNIVQEPFIASEVHVLLQVEPNNSRGDVD